MKRTNEEFGEILRRADMGEPFDVRRRRPVAGLTLSRLERLYDAGRYAEALRLARAAGLVPGPIVPPVEQPRPGPGDQG